MKTSFKKKPGAAAAAKKTPAAAPRTPAKKQPTAAAPPQRQAPPRRGPAQSSAPARPAPMKRASTPPPGVRTNAPAREVEAELLPPEGEEQQEEQEQQAPPPRAAGMPRRKLVPQLTAGEEGDIPDDAALSTNMFTAPVGQSVGCYDASDYDMPLFQMAQGSDSPLILDDGFADGDLVLNKEVICWQDGCDPVEITVLRMQKQFEAQVKYGGEMPKIYDTPEQAAADGLIPFGGEGAGYRPIVNLIILVKQPEGTEGSIFNYEFEGVFYAQALWRIKGASYKTVARKIKNAERLHLKTGLHHGSFQVEYTKERGAAGPYWLTRLTNGEMHSAEFVQFAEDVANGLAEG